MILVCFLKPVYGMQAEFSEKKAMVYYIAHEVRNPLNTVSMGVDTVLEDLMSVSSGVNPEMVLTLKDVRKCCDDAINILNETLLVEKLKAGTVVLEKEKIAVEKFVVESVHPFHIQVCG
jgi:signal transduction histidine kinase